MNITLLSVNIETKPSVKSSYQIADVAYKNNTYGGKVEGKKVMSFGVTAEAFKVLAAASPNENFEVTVVKNDKGYNDWVAVRPAGAAASAAPPTPGLQRGSAATPAPAGTGRSYGESPEERAQRQISIVRQSSLSNAVATLSVGAKKLEPDDVIKVAKQYEDFVHGRGATGFDDLPNFDPKEFVVPEVN